MISFVILTLFPLCMIFVMFFDIFTMTIPNKIVLALLAGFIVCVPFVGMSMETLVWHLGISTLVLLCTFGLFAMGVMGGGDAKLATVASLWLGAIPTLEFLLIASLMGGALTVLILVLRQVPLPKPVSGAAWLQRLHDTKSGVPYGAALGPGALIVFLNTPWMEYATTGVPFG